MSAPLGLTIKTDLQSMNIGDAIICKYVASSGAVGTFSELGTSVASEIPVASTATPSGTFYFIKVAKGLLIADRNIQCSISWDTLRTGKHIDGKVVTFNSIDTLIGSISGGVAYSDVNGAYSTTDLGYGGFPKNNQWDRYIVSSTLGGKITAGDDNVWHWSNLYSITRDTPTLALVASTYRSCRGKDLLNKWVNALSSTATTLYGFRPTLEYIDNSIYSGKRPTTLFY